MRHKAFTLLELLVALGMTALIAAASTSAIATLYSIRQRLSDAALQSEDRRQFETEISHLLRRAYLDQSASGIPTYFIGTVGNQTPGQATQAQGNQSQANSTQVGTGSDSTSLTFTITGYSSPMDEMNSQDTFEQLNQDYGPKGGTSEIQLGTQPVGSPPAQDTGAFLRVQTPADSDATQGGNERLLEAGVQDLSFEFFNGTQWTSTWNTQAMQTPRLPSEVQVTYRLQGDQSEHIFVVGIPGSDVTPLNPVTTGAQ